MAILVAEKVFRNDPVLELWRQRPFTGHHVVAWQIPPEVILQLLGTAIDLPAPADLEAFAVHDEYAGRTVRSIFSATSQRAHIDALRPAMDRVRPGVARLFENLLGLDDFVNRSLGWIGLGVHDVDTRRAQSGDEEVTSLDERMPRERRQSRGAGVPAEMVELVAFVRHDHGVDDLAIGWRARLHVDNGKRVGL